MNSQGAMPALSAAEIETFERDGYVVVPAMFGAAVLARRSIELTDQEKRAAMSAHDAKISNERGTDS